MRQLIAAFLIIGLTSCQTTTYYSSNSSVSFGAPEQNERIVGHNEEEFKEHYFVFGLLPRERKRDLASVMEVKPNERLVNVRVTNNLEFVDGFLKTLGTLFLFSAVWEMRTTTVKADRVTPLKTESVKPDIAPLHPDTQPEK